MHARRLQDAGDFSSYLDKFIRVQIGLVIAVALSFRGAGFAAMKAADTIHDEYKAAVEEHCMLISSLRVRPSA